MNRFRWTGGIALLALTASACGMGGDGAGGAQADGKEGGHVVYAESIPPNTAWSPETDDAHDLMRAGCLETLVRYGYGGDLEAGLATEWNQVEPTTWQFTLREGVSFQDGTPMDAEAVAGALTHLLEVKTPARAFNADVVSSVEAVDESTVEITTPAPDALVPLRVASPNAGILAPKAYAGKQIDIKGTCTGPFTVVDEQPRQSLKLEANEEYWGGAPALATAEVRFIIDGATRTTQLQTGEAQIARSLPAANLSTVEGDSTVELNELALARTTVMLLNNSRAPFDDPLVREAIQHALDREAIVASVYEGTGQPAVGPFAPESPWAPEGAEVPTFDPGEARSLLAEAGIDPESVTIDLLAYNDRPEFADLAAVVQEQLAQIGVKVKIRAGDYASLEPDMLSGDFDAALFSRGALVDVADPGGYLSSDWTCDGGYNIAHYCSDETDAMIQDAVATEDLDERNAAYQDIAERLQSESASIFLLHESAVWGARTDVEGFEPHPLDYYVLTADLTLAGS